MFRDNDVREPDRSARVVPQGDPNISRVGASEPPGIDLLRLGAMRGGTGLTAPSSYLNEPPSARYPSRQQGGGNWDDYFDHCCIPLGYSTVSG